MSSEERLPAQLQQVLKKGFLKRLPLTFLPFVNQQIRDWDYLFPFERQSVLRLLMYLGELDDLQFAGLFRSLREIEARMEVSRWPFSTEEQTIENASLLARSPYYQEWREEVQKVFDHLDQQAPAGGDQAGRKSRNRLVLLIFPARLPLDRATAWERWQGMGRELKLDLAGEERSSTEILLRGLGQAENSQAPGVLEVLAQRSSHSLGDLWVLDADASLSEQVLKLRPPGGDTAWATLLSFERLTPFREGFLQQINVMRKDLADADAVYARLRKTDLAKWCPPEIASQPIVREFLRSLFLNGNGALVYGNAFVEWAASEAFRRARPSVLVGQFGVRYKPKAFTSVAVFENQEQASPLPPVEDLPGSALDAQILALYVWLAAGRYSEYHRQAACLCLAENLGVAYAVAPPDFPLWQEAEPIKLGKLSAVLRAWLG